MRLIKSGDEPSSPRGKIRQYLKDKREKKADNYYKKYMAYFDALDITELRKIKTQLEKVKYKKVDVLNTYFKTFASASTALLLSIFYYMFKGKEVAKQKLATLSQTDLDNLYSQTNTGNIDELASVAFTRHSLVDVFAPYGLNEVMQQHLATSTSIGLASFACIFTLWYAIPKIRQNKAQKQKIAYSALCDTIYNKEESKLS